MKSALQTTLVATTLVASTCGALASTVLLDFDEQGTAAETTNKPVALSSVPGFSFLNDFGNSTAWAYKWEMLLAGSDILPGEFDAGSCDLPTGACNKTGFIMNRPRGAGGSKIVLSIDDAAYPGQYFQSVSFNLFTNAVNTPLLTAVNASGESWLVSELTTGDGNNLWTLSEIYKVNQGPFSQATRLVFDFGTSVVGLDDLSISLTEATNVPEPASYALVGLALLAAGSASRRRRG